VSAADQVERELKLGAWPEFVLPDLAGLDAEAEPGEPTRQDLDAVYYDTPDLRLLRRGVTLRFRRGEPPADVWTVKLPSDGAAQGLARREITMTGSRDRLPREFADVTRAWAFGRTLRPVARMHTLRVSVPLLDARGALQAVLADDAVTVSRGRRVLARFRELEVELAAGAPHELLSAVGERLHSAGAEKVQQIPKLTRALGREALEPWELAPPELGQKASLAAAAHAFFTKQLACLVDVHALVTLAVPGSAATAQAAVASLQAGLHAYAVLIATELSRVSVDSLAWLGDGLSAAAELDALADLVAAEPAAPLAVTVRERELLAARVEASHDRVRRRLARSLRERRYTALLDSLRLLATAPVSDDGPGGRRLSAAGPKFVRGCWRQIRDEAQPDAAALRRVEAALELVAPVSADAAATLEQLQAVRTATANAALADALARRLRVLSRDADAPVVWAAGVLAGEQAVRAHAQREQAEILWEQLARKGSWSWAE